MKTPFDINKKVEETLNSLDGIQRAEGQPFFYTRIKARLERGEGSFWGTVGSLLAKPVVVVACLCFILAFNAVIVFRQDAEKQVASGNSASDVISTDNEYVLASNSSFDYENLDQQ